MSSCQGGSDATGHLANWLDDGNLNVETKVLGRTGWGQVEVDLIWGWARVVFVLFGLHNWTKV